MTDLLVWVLIGLESKFQVKVSNLDNIGYESVELYLEELDETLLSIDFPKYLPNPCLFINICYEDEYNQWLVGIALHPETLKRLMSIWMKNGEVIEWEIFE